MTDERVSDVRCTGDTLTVDPMGGRMIAVPLACYPPLLAGTPDQPARWQLCAEGLGVHWRDLDEDKQCHRPVARNARALGWLTTGRFRRADTPRHRPGRYQSFNADTLRG
jgi:hypothetical protein